MKPVLTQFADLLRSSQSPDLSVMALQVARIEYPDLNFRPYLKQLDEMADCVRAVAGRSALVLDVIDALNDHLYVELGFKGNTGDYYDPRNSLLNDVIDRRLGIPITLSIVYLAVARRLGLATNGVSFPAHFLIRVELRPQPLILDPFNDGQILVAKDLRALLQSSGMSEANAPLKQLLGATSNTDVISRVLRNLKRIYLEREDAGRSLPVVEHLLALEPDAVGEIRDRGYLYQALECYDAARVDFERYLELAPFAADGEQIRARCRDLANDNAKQLH